MIFISFSSKDTQGPLKQVLYFAEKYTLPVTYDTEKLSEDGDYNLKGFSEGIEQSSHAIILLTPNSILSTCIQEEIQQICLQYEAGAMTVFPVLYGVTPEELPSDLKFLTEMTYYTAEYETEIYEICHYIMEDIFTEELRKYPYQELQEFIVQNLDIPLMRYPASMLNFYSVIADGSQRMKIAILYAVYIYLQNAYGMEEIPSFYYGGINKVFDEARLQYTIENQEIVIFEKQLLALINAILFGYRG